MNTRALVRLLCVVSVGYGCAEQIVVISRDNDDFSIPEPEYDEEGEYIWSDGAYYMSIYQLEKPLDVGWILRKAGLLDEEEAENVDSRDEVPDSTWFTNRRGAQRMSIEELVRGPGSGIPPAGRWTVVKGKELGISPGFVVKDERERLLFVKFDPPDFPGMGTNADVVVSRFLHAAGYNVPEYYWVTIDPDSLILSPEAKIPGKYKVKRPMTQKDLEEILAKAPRDSEGRILANVSVGLPGKPKGPFSFHGLRQDDPNDTVLHQNRRELRGLRVLMAWLNNTDSRRGNSLDMYVEENGRRFLRHYLIDFSGSFGSGNNEPKDLYFGHEYLIDPEMISRSLGAFGIWVKPWEVKDPETFGSLGTFGSQVFRPEGWRGTYANPAFEKMTVRDAFWAARIVTAFTDEEIRAIVSTGYYVEPEAEEYLVQALIERRDAIGSYWFDVDKINPLDNFHVTTEDNGVRVLSVDDLAVDRGYAEKESTRYRYRIDDGPYRFTEKTQIPLGRGARQTEVVIETSREQDNWGREVSVLTRAEGEELAVVRIER